jgi:hypothetical protein
MSAPHISGTASGLLLPTPLTIAVSTAKAEQTYQRDIERVGGPTWQAVLAVAERKWPTPQASDNRPRATAASTARRVEIGKQVSLEAAVKFWPTPTAHNAKEGGFPSEYERNTPTLAAQAGGSLNPTWVEWLMGWPLGWTDLKPLATDKSPCAQPQHGTS